jgi:hypothetical protein
MTLVYWVAHCLTDSPAYSIRAKTRKECYEKLHNGNVDLKNYSEPRKITVEYASGFDLVEQCLGEGGLYEETTDRHNCTSPPDEDSN